MNGFYIFREVRMICCSLTFKGKCKLLVFNLLRVNINCILILENYV